MKNIIGSLILVFITQLSFGQTIRLNLGGSYHIHLKNSSNENPYVPTQYQSIVEAPSIANFFHNNISSFIDLSLQFKIPTTTLEIGVGLSYEKIKLINETPEAEYILGHEFINQMITPYVRIGTKLSSNYYYLMVGISLNQPEGKGIIPAGEMTEQELRTEVNYTAGTAFRLGGGVDFLLTEYFALNLASNIDFRSIKRGDVKFYSDEILLFEAKPVGDLSLSDHSISLIATITFYVDIF